MPKIMIVDDEESLRELIKNIFEQEGYEVIEALSGHECLELLRTEKPDLILMDMMMPNMNGLETTEKIRSDSKTKNLKVAFLTVVRFSEKEKESLKKLNILDYITKPFENEDLTRRVKILC